MGCLLMGLPLRFNRVNRVLKWKTYLEFRTPTHERPHQSYSHTLPQQLLLGFTFCHNYFINLINEESQILRDPLHYSQTIFQSQKNIPLQCLLLTILLISQ